MDESRKGFFKLASLKQIGEWRKHTVKAGCWVCDYALDGEKIGTVLFDANEGTLSRVEEAGN